MQQKPMSLIELHSVSVCHGYEAALHEVSLQVAKGKLVLLIGRHDAGKITLLRTILELHRSRRGKTKMNGMDITGRRTEHIVKLRVSLEPEGSQLFSDQTVLNDLLLGAYCRYGKSESRQIKVDVENLMGCFPLLKQRQNQMAGTLRGEQQQIVAICRGLMSKPHFLLLDEPSLGLNQHNMSAVFEIIKALPALGIGLFLTEQAVRRALSIPD